MKMKLDNAFYVEPKGVAGGLALWWSSNVKISILGEDRNFIDTSISIHREEDWFGTFIYAPPYTEEKQKFWDMLASLIKEPNPKWYISGDSNIVASPTDKYGGLTFDHNSARWYYDFLDRTFLTEIQCKGGVYTWSNQRSNEATILEKLDRALSSIEWNCLYPRAIAVIDVAIASDHSPTVLLTNGIIKKIRADFKFESKWLVEEECSQVVKEEWEIIGNGTYKGSFRIKLRRTSVKLRNWNIEKFGKNQEFANEIMGEIKQLQDEPLSAEESQVLKDLKRKLLKIWEGEEKYWQQRSRID
ncbi:hypothetical protein V6N12_045814 [Hibiscus sabdariffa]|uniref:Endonuclease/exonuclease/phosphatase domain-containing protein n=1 Tax=Hibiscus sabdariffa TaxID=183260 RepID=A0ABR2G4S5_9ROSI